MITSADDRWRVRTHIGQACFARSATVTGHAFTGFTDEERAAMQDILAKIGFSDKENLDEGAAWPVGSALSASQADSIDERNQLARPPGIFVERLAIVIPQMRVQHGNVHEHESSQHNQGDCHSDPGARDQT